MKSYKQITQVKWDALNDQPRFQPRYPHERVIQFLYHNFNHDQFRKLKILDHGCGAGRHVVFLAEQGVGAYGADISEAGLEHTKKILRKRKLKAKLDLIVNNTLPYPDNFFNAVISFGVLYYLNLGDIKKVVEEIRRILKSGGKAMFVLRSVKDYRYEHGRKVSTNTYIVRENDKNVPAANEDGMLMRLFTPAEIKKLCKDFSELKIDDMYNSYNNHETWNWDFVVTCSK